MRPSVTLAMTALLVGSACAPLGGATHIDYIDFIREGGIEYTAVWDPARALGDADLGPEQFRVRTTLAGAGKSPWYHPVDGDAAYVRSGEPVYAVRGYAPTFRLAARHDGRLVLYEVFDNPRAKAGRDLLDIGGKVSAITLNSKTDRRSILGRIDEAARVDALVRLVVAAPVDPQRRGQLAAFVSFRLQDGTATTQAYLSDVPMLGRGILVPPEFAAAMEQLLASAPTPTPVPATVNLAQRYRLAQATRLTIKRLDPPGGLVRDAARAQQFVAMLDADLPAMREPTLPPTDAVVIFEFSDHYVSLAYDAVGDTLTVVAPQDHFAVRPPPQFRELLRQAP